jgi:hypothetical protein
MSNPTLSRLRLLLDGHHQAHGCANPCGVCLALEEIGSGEGVQSGPRCRVEGCGAEASNPESYVCVTHTAGWCSEWFFCDTTGYLVGEPCFGRHSVNESHCSLHGGRDYAPSQPCPSPGWLGARCTLPAGHSGAHDYPGRCAAYGCTREAAPARIVCAEHLRQHVSRPRNFDTIPTISRPSTPARPPSPTAPPVPGLGREVATHGAPVGVSAEEMAQALRGEGEGLDGAQEPARLTVGVDRAAGPERSSVVVRRPYSRAISYISHEEADAWVGDFRAAAEVNERMMRDLMRRHEEEIFRRALFGTWPTHLGARVATDPTPEEAP